MMMGRGVVTGASAGGGMALLYHGAPPAAQGCGPMQAPAPGRPYHSDITCASARGAGGEVAGIWYNSREESVLMKAEPRLTKAEPRPMRIATPQGEVKVDGWCYTTVGFR